MSHFDMYDAIARSHNDAHPEGPYVTSTNVRQELHRLLGTYGRFKYLRESEIRTERGLCSFCNQEYPQIQGLIVGLGGVCICFECIDKCSEIAEELRRQKQ